MSSSTRRGVILGSGFVLTGIGARALAQSRRRLAAGDVSASQVDLGSASDAVKRLYAGQNAPLWTDRNAAALAEGLERASAHGLDPQPYLALIEGSTSVGDRDLNLSRTALAYSKALAIGLVDPSKIFSNYTIARDAPDLVVGLRSALADQRVTAWLAGLTPQDSLYAALSAAYLEMAGRSSASDLPPVPPGPSIRVGDRDGRRAAVLAALAGASAPNAVVQPQSNIWTQADADLLKTYQRSRGLAEDGVVGPNTLALLNASSRDKARRLAVNLERLRWLQREPPPTRIDVNTAASMLSYIVNGEVAWTSIVVPGRPGHETPQLQASFERLVVNPPWYVPASIARREITPKGPGYLARNHMRRVSGRIIQSPGPWAALGQVKFDMQNRYAIYLHDTPSKSVFSRSQRHLSHGCIRVQHAVEFGRRLATSSGNGDRFDSILKSGRTGVVPLRAPIPVRLIYLTALFGDDGAVTFRPDIYGWDVRTASAMGLTAPAREGVEAVTAAPLGP
ncbi:L,D-transpeptidase family protein [Phenylobacterium immobile]|uniref:L,D-transpeptidase family protein n=1 Tax=Phenylobacterium immobile TaxID=21 RepID=UPI001146CF08|nr:L,D-transpeptidase family protein [Phenylobacterium immobile]